MVWSGAVDVTELNVVVPQMYPATVTGVSHCGWTSGGVVDVDAGCAEDSRLTPRLSRRLVWIAWVVRAGDNGWSVIVTERAVDLAVTIEGSAVPAKHRDQYVDHLSRLKSMSTGMHVLLAPHLISCCRCFSDA